MERKHVKNVTTKYDHANVTKKQKQILKGTYMHTYVYVCCIYVCVLYICVLYI